MATKIAFVTLTLLIVGGVAMLEPIHATPPPALDGVGSSSTCGMVVTYNQVCATQSLTTARGHDLIILVAECGSFGACNPSNNISSIVDNSGLTFTQRFAYAPVSNAPRCCPKQWEYYAVAEAPLKSDNITVIFSIADHYLDSSLVFQVLAIKGVNPQNTFDRSPTFPANVLCESPHTRFECSVSVETSASDSVIATVAINDAGPCTVPAGFLAIGSSGGQFEADYLVVSSSQTNLLFSCSGSDPVAISVDAVSLLSPFSRA
jgi:hypothetical protein